ncbi:hypothetical protein [Cognatiyoonia sp. IB215182]|uniref:hypothetical protein n=1 Tax=Cognatiyoonia sp. IB215182 TaxID=3097353 RepID=UPI002A163939|nr:hypothetical protein [Cognatiyoonia sp. IB215182]MDX8355529.1 hypothetical protein [Cognatiyoonia sp. IB215182]
MGKVETVPNSKARSGLRFEVLASTDAMDDIVYLAQQSHSESRFSYIEFAPDKVRSIAERAISDPKQHAVMVCWDADRPVGFVFCSVGEYHIGAGTLVTTIHNLNVLKDVRHSLKGGRVAIGLLNGVTSWSRARSAAEVLFHVTSDVELGRTHKFIKRLGYRFIGGSYAKDLG